MRRSRALLAVTITALTLAGTAPAGGATPAAAAAPRPCRHRPPSGVTTRHLTSGGTRRDYLLEVPTAARKGARLPLILNFHGLGSNMQQQAAYTALNTKGGAAGYVVVTPDGTGEAVKRWTVPPRSDTDVDFVRALLRRTERDLCIARDRVFATGISNGAILATALPCALPGTFAAIAPVAGVNALKVCAAGTPPVTVVAFHGTADGLVPYGGGRYFQAAQTDPALAARLRQGLGGEAALSGRVQARPVEQAVAEWAAFDGCGSTAAVTQPAADVRRTAYAGCDDDRRVTLYTVEGGGHTWPGADLTGRQRLGATTQSIDATDLMLAAFDRSAR